MSDYVNDLQAARTVYLGGTGVVFRLSAGDTQNEFVVVEHPLKPQTLAAPIHTHSREDEYSYILEGRVTIMIEDEIFTVGPGAWVRKPRGIPHCFWNAESSPARVLEIITPPGLEAYFLEMADLAASHPRDFEGMVRIQQKYGLTSDPASIPMLCQKYNLSLEGSPEEEAAPTGSD